jgi:tripartite-type tricarboxylate transporter receptor subunit TctC
MWRWSLAVVLVFPGLVLAQACPEKNLNYWQAFPAGGESDISARHQQYVLKKRCPAIETIIQYKPGAGGGLMWAQMNQLPADGVNIVGVNLPHIVLQPLEGQVQYKTDDVTPVYWFHYTPDALVIPESSSIRSFQDFVAAAKAQPEKITLGGSGLNSANHAAHERLNASFGVKTTYVPFKGTGDMTTAVIGGHVSGAMSYTAFAINNKGRCAHWRWQWTSAIRSFRTRRRSRSSAWTGSTAPSAASACRSPRRRNSASACPTSGRRSTPIRK